MFEKLVKLCTECLIPTGSSDKNSNRSVETNLLTFYNVKKMDSKVIQCNVTNKYGYAFTNAYLNVMGKHIFKSHALVKKVQS